MFVCVVCACSCLYVRAYVRTCVRACMRACPLKSFTGAQKNTNTEEKKTDTHFEALRWNCTALIKRPRRRLNYICLYEELRWNCTALIKRPMYIYMYILHTLKRSSVVAQSLSKIPGSVLIKNIYLFYFIFFTL